MFVCTAPEMVRAGEEKPRAVDYLTDIPYDMTVCAQLQKRSEQMKKNLEQQIT